MEIWNLADSARSGHRPDGLVLVHRGGPVLSRDSCPSGTATLIVSTKNEVKEQVVNRPGNETLQCHDLFVEITPRLEADRKLERELDCHLAPRFNVFKYLRKDELGLSCIIADLLDPNVARRTLP